MMKLEQIEVVQRKRSERIVVVRFVVLVALEGRCIPGSMGFEIEIDLERSKLVERMILVALEGHCTLDCLGCYLDPCLLLFL